MPFYCQLALICSEESKKKKLLWCLPEFGNRKRSEGENAALHASAGSANNEITQFHSDSRKKNLEKKRNLGFHGNAVKSNSCPTFGTTFFRKKMNE